MYVGRAVPAPRANDGGRGVVRACVDRIGIVGICSMALLSGFASVSSPWHALLNRRANRGRPVTEADVRRKAAGLDATMELLSSKRHRLQLLEGRAATAAAVAPSTGLFGRLVGSIKEMRPGGDAAEISALRTEVAGLESMAEGVSETRDPCSRTFPGSAAVW